LPNGWDETAILTTHFKDYSKLKKALNYWSIATADKPK
jgi:hypothetical protein